VRRFTPTDVSEYIAGDLDEEYSSYQASRGRWAAKFWYWSQVVRSLAHASRTESVMAEPYALRPSRVSDGLTVLRTDAQFAVRALRHSPGYAAAALLTLGIGVGASVAIFSAVNQVLLRPLPYAEPHRLAMLWESNQTNGWTQVEAAPANLLDWRERAASFSDIAFVNPFSQTLSLMTDGGPVPATAAQVSGNLFSVLGVPPLLGRVFREDETFTPGIAVVSHEVWRRHFGADPETVGRVIRLDGGPYEVIGVMGPAFRYPIGEAEIWTTPAALASRRESIWWRQAHVVKPIARLAPGASFEQASAELAAIAADLEREFPDTNTGMEAGLTPLQSFLAGDQRAALLLLLGAVAVLQLIACANVANLMLGRAMGRRQELAVRAALGAGRGRLLRQVLTEALVLAAGGTMLGLGLAAAGLGALASVSPPDLDAFALSVDWRLMTFAAGLCVVSAGVFGAWPALRSARDETVRHLSPASRTMTAGPGRLLATNGLIAVEIALAVLLLSAAGLMVRTLTELSRIDSGVNTADVLTFQVHPSTGAYPNAAARARFAVELVDRLGRLPGVTVAGAGRGLPLTGYSWSSDFTIDRWEPGRFGVEVRHREALPGYFDALDVPLLQGRMFDDRDLTPDAPVPVLVNQAFADRYFPDESPVGRLVVFDREPTERSYWYPIIGVVGNERKDLLTEPVPEIIAHLHGDTPSTISFVVRTVVAPLSIVPQVRSVVSEIDPEAPLLSVRTMDGVVAEARTSERFLLTLLAVFAAAALVLAAVGVYGVANQAARARTREVGIRLALGAPGSAVVRGLVARGALFVALGIAAGTVGALFSSRLLEAQLYQVNPRDPATLSVVAGLIALVAVTAILWPTWRATRVDPVSVLRDP
jgi:predicted permease